MPDYETVSSWYYAQPSTNNKWWNDPNSYTMQFNKKMTEKAVDEGIIPGTTDSNGNKKFTKAAGIIGSLGNVFGNFANADTSDLTQGVSTLTSTMLNTTPVGQLVNAGLQAWRAGLKAFGLDSDYVTKDVAKRQNINSSATWGNQLANAFGIPGAKAMTAYALNPEASASYGGVAQTAQDIGTMSGKRFAFNLRQINKAIAKGNQQILDTNEIVRDAKKNQTNYLPLLQTATNQLIYNGIKPQLSLKKGGAIPELEEVRTIMQSLQSKKQEIQEPQKFQLGGKMNMIVTGALHARKHNLEELNPNLEGEITKKGIPVVVMNDGGEVQSQPAEVEKEELVLQIDTTKTIEDYYDEYNSTDSKTEKNKIALECGKYLVDELLKNTDDPDKLIKKTV